MTYNRVESCGYSRRKAVAASYEAGGSRSEWNDLDLAHRMDALLTALILKNCGVIPMPKKGETTMILSPSANNGYFEGLLKWMLGKNYLVVASDLADMRSFGDGGFKGRKSIPIRADAATLPFPECFDVVFDRAGVMYHEAQFDMENPQNNARNVLQLFYSYSLVLKPGGLLIIDHKTRYDNSTGPLVDTALKDRKPDGFTEPFIIGFHNWQYRVYTKL